MGRVNTASTEKLSSIQQEVLVGTLLGDGRLECRSKNGGARLRVHHADSQYDFLYWKYNIFRNVVTREPWKVMWQSYVTGTLYPSWFFHTKTLLSLRSLYQLFYPKGKKVVPDTIGTLLTPRALATWFMDDGCSTRTSLILNTQGFLASEQVLLQHWLKRKLRIETTLQKDRLTYRLWMNAVNAQRFMNVIHPYILPCMQYKIKLPVTTDSFLLHRKVHGEKDEIAQTSLREKIHERSYAEVVLIGDKL